MVIQDRMERKIYLFEIKRGAYPSSLYTKNLESVNRDKIIKNHLKSEIAGKYVLYGGEEDRSGKIPFINSAEFLCCENIADFLKEDARHGGNHSENLSQ